ncbi:unnamed protein product [Eruca vesicaria subsp. sativa]|uniref:Uncharacterized protein n=1 Tax=Eruca vesicaria subsp. sativa TaxID=29727 RepID=A0ABC8L7L1_ERUVS|nr:unnamed protein product [Eruca vesicaria subsp. sativa]
MGCCLSKKTSPSSSSPSGVSPDPNKSAIDKPLRRETEAHEKLEVEEPKPKNEAEIQENGNPRKEVFVIKHRRSHERSKTTTDPDDSTASEEKSTGTNQTPADVDAILIQCGRLSRSNSAAAKTRRYSGSKRSFDFDKNERSSRDGDADEADAEDGEEEEAERRIHRHRQRGGDSPRERRRRTPSREREDSKSYRSGSRERGSGSRRVSRSPGRRSDTNPNPNSCAGSGSSVNSSNNRPAKFVSVPATDKASSLVMEKSNKEDPSIKRIAVKRNVASPRSQSPARAASPRAQSPARAAVNASSNAQPSPSKLRRKTEHSPYRRNPLGEIDPNSLAYPQPQASCNKKMVNRENESQGLVKESVNFDGQKMNAKAGTQPPSRRSASPSRVTKEAVEECKIVVSGTELPKAQVMSRSRSLRKSRDFDFSPEALLSNNIDNNNNAPPASYAALLLEDIQNFHQKSVNVNAITSSMSKACSIVEAVSDLNSTTNKHQRNELNNFASAAVKKADLMEPSFEKYVTVKRGGSSLEDMEEQESSGSNSITGSSCVVQRKGYSSREPNSAESTDRMSGRSSNKERDRSPFGVQEFDPLKKNGVGVGGKRVATTTRVATVSV